MAKLFPTSILKWIYTEAWSLKLYRIAQWAVSELNARNWWWSDAGWWRKSGWS